MLHRGPEWAGGPSRDSSAVEQFEYRAQGFDRAGLDRIDHQLNRTDSLPSVGPELSRHDIRGSLKGRRTVFRVIPLNPTLATWQANLDGNGPLDLGGIPAEIATGGVDDIP
jgi:hypothetical protein